MKRVFIWLVRWLGRWLARHRDQVVSLLARGIAAGGAGALGHFGASHAVIAWWQWGSEAAGGAVFFAGGLIWQSFLKRWSRKKQAAVLQKQADIGKSTVRVAVAAVISGVPVAEVSEDAIAAVPDSLHDQAVAQVVVLNKNGGVPAPALVGA